MFVVEQIRIQSRFHSTKNLKRPAVLPWAGWERGWGGRRRSGGARWRTGRTGGGVNQAPPTATCDRWSARRGSTTMSAEGAEPGPGSGPGPGPEPGPLCPEHGQALSWFCRSERRPVCAACAGLGGRCQGHRIRRAEERAEELRVSGRGCRKARALEGLGAPGGTRQGLGSLGLGGHDSRPRSPGSSVALAVGLGG